VTVLLILGYGYFMRKRGFVDQKTENVSLSAECYWEEGSGYSWYPRSVFASSITPSISGIYLDCRLVTDIDQRDETLGTSSQTPARHSFSTSTRTWFSTST